jgi:hypothetical protein
MEEVGAWANIGDIIVLCHKSIQLGRLINKGKKISKEPGLEIRELRDDLDLFVRILMQVSNLMPHVYIGARVRLECR